MAHDHVPVAVEGSATSGVEFVPAQQLGVGKWLLLRSPLYALQLAAGDTIQMAENGAGVFEVVARGGNVAVHFYLPENQLDDPGATTCVETTITPQVVGLGGRLDGQTTGLLVYTIPIEASFPVIEGIFATALDQFPGAQWQYTNVYDSTTGEPLGWWQQP
jgi:hypothetical protein